MLNRKIINEYVIGLIITVTTISAQDLIVSGEDIYLAGEHHYENIIISGGGSIRLTEYGGEQEVQGKLILNCDSLVISNSSMINGVGAGGQFGQGIGGNGGNGQNEGRYSGGGGGSHSGIGGMGGGDVPGIGGTPYGDINELNRGSWGGIGYGSDNSYRGKGGGGIHIISKYAQINGNIMMDGTSANVNEGQGGSGGGSGGMIKLDIKTLLITGELSTKGGNGGNGLESTNYGGGGGGGGGRITIKTESMIDTSLLQVNGGIGGDNGYGYPGITGTEGDIYYLKIWITSDTHPNEDKWYVNPIPEIELDALGDIYGYYYMIDQNPNGMADQTSEFTQQNTLTIDTLPDGEWYFHGVPLNVNYEILESQQMTYQLNIQNGPLMISSPTHPQENYSYNNSNPVFNIESHEGISNYIYKLDQNEETIPIMETGIYLENTSLIIPGVPNGTHWLHVVGVDEVGYVGSQASHYKINIGICEEEVIIDDCGECCRSSKRRE